MTETKRCTGCGEIKLLTEFSKDATRRDGPAPRYPQLLDETWLRTQIEREFLTAEQVAESLGCSSNTVYRAMRRYGIRTIPKGVRWALRARLIQQRSEGSV